MVIYQAVAGRQPLANLHGHRCIHQDHQIVLLEWRIDEQISTDDLSQGCPGAAQIVHRSYAPPEGPGQGKAAAYSVRIGIAMA